MSLKNGKANSKSEGYEIYEPPSMSEISERILKTLARRKEICERAIERGDNAMGNRAEIREIKKMMKTARAICRLERERGADTE